MINQVKGLSVIEKDRSDGGTILHLWPRSKCEASLGGPVWKRTSELRQIGCRLVLAVLLA